MALVASGGVQRAQAIPSLGRIAAVSLHRVVQRPHPVAAQVEVKEQVELASGVLVSPDRGRRLLRFLCCRPQQARRCRLVQPDQLVSLRQGIGRRGIGGRGGGRARRREGGGRAGCWHCRCWLSPCQHLTAGVRHWDVGRQGRLRFACRPSGRWWRHPCQRPNRRGRIGPLSGTGCEHTYPQTDESAIDKQIPPPGPRQPVPRSGSGATMILDHREGQYRRALGES